jgi:hypothetical protein
MPNILFASNNAAHWSGAGTSANSGHDATKVPYSVLVNNTTMSPIFKPSTTDETWIHFRSASFGVATNGTSPLFRVRGNNQASLLYTYAVQFQNVYSYNWYDTNGGSNDDRTGWNGEAIWDIGCRFTPFLMEYQLYRNGSLIAGHTFASNPNGIDRVESVEFLRNGIAFDEFFVADGDTRGGRLNMLRPVNLGAYDQWTGSIVALADDDPLSAITTNLPNNRTTLDFGSFDTIQNISNVVIASLTKRGLNSPSKLRHSLRRTGVDYDDAAPFDIAFDSQLNISDYPINPSTMLAWQPADIALTEFGFKAEA